MKQIKSLTAFFLVVISIFLSIGCEKTEKWKNPNLPV